MIKGVIPVAPTPFNPDGTLDLEGQRRVIDCMVDQGADAICILANYSEQFVLSDDERAQLMRICIEQIAGRVPVIVTCSHFSTGIVQQRCRDAAAMGAAMIMLMPPYHGASLHATEQGIYEHFAIAAEAGKVPVMVQDAPLSGVTLSVEFLVRMARDLPLVRHFKIETPLAANKLRRLIELGGDAIESPFDGEESITLMADLHAGATGTMCSALLPDLIGQVVKRFMAGDKKAAADEYARLLPLINFENRQCGLRACKTIMMQGGVIRSDHVRHPINPVDTATREQLIELAQALQPMSLTWGK